MRNHVLHSTLFYYYFGTRFPDERMASIGQTNTQR